MERDLSVIRKKRAMREGVKIPSVAPSPIEIPAETEKQDPENVQTDTGLDLPMIDANAEASLLQDTASENQPQAPQQASGDQIITAEQGMPQGTSESASLAITLPAETKLDEKDASNTVDTTTQEAGAKMEDIMASNNEPNQQAEIFGTDLDFESMFNDADFTAADGSMNFDIDFSTTGQEANQGQDLLADNAFENIAMTDSDPTNVAPTANEDITGLLDDVFNQVGDTANVSINQVTVSGATKATENASEAPSQPTASGTAPSQFDDLFGTDSFDLGGNDEVNGGDGNLADFDFDEEWLKM